MAAADPRDEGPAPLGSWGRVYALVIAFAVLVWVALYALTRAFDLPLPR